MSKRKKKHLCLERALKQTHWYHYVQCAVWDTLIFMANNAFNMYNNENYKGFNYPSHVLRLSLIIMHGPLFRRFPTD